MSPAANILFFSAHMYCCLLVSSLCLNCGLFMSMPESPQKEGSKVLLVLLPLYSPSFHLLLRYMAIIRILQKFFPKNVAVVLLLYKSLTLKRHTPFSVLIRRGCLLRLHVHSYIRISDRLILISRIQNRAVSCLTHRFFIGW